MFENAVHVHQFHKILLHMTYYKKLFSTFNFAIHLPVVFFFALMSLGSGLPGKVVALAIIFSPSCIMQFYVNLYYFYMVIFSVIHRRFTFNRACMWIYKFCNLDLI